jgi:hypothetical protein
LDKQRHRGVPLFLTGTPRCLLEVQKAAKFFLIALLKRARCPWFHELGFPWYGFENPIEPVEPVEISLSYSQFSKDMSAKSLWESFGALGQLWLNQKFLGELFPANRAVD